MGGLFSRAYDAKWIILGIILLTILLWMALPFVTPIVFALFIYYITRPVKRRLQPYIRNESLRALFCLLLLALPLLLVLAYTLLIAVGQINAFFGYIGLQSLPLGPISNASSEISLIGQSSSPDRFRSENMAVYFSGIYQLFQGHSGTIAFIKDIVLTFGLTLVDIALRFFVMLVIAFLLLVADDRFARWFKSTFPRMMQEHNGLLPRYTKAVDSDIASIFSGNMLSVIIFALMAAIVYYILNFFAPDPSLLIPFPLLLGILCGLFAFLPVLGPWIVDIPILAFVTVNSLMAGTFSENYWYILIMALTIFIFVENLPGYLMRPLLSHGQEDVVLLMLAYIVGPIIFGIPGLFIGSIILVLVTHFFNIVVPQLSGSQKSG